VHCLVWGGGIRLGAAPWAGGGMSARTSHTTTGVATQGRAGGRTRPEYLGSPGRCQRRGPLGRYIQCVGRRPWAGLHVPTLGSRTPSERGRRPVGHPPKFARHGTLLAAPIRSRHCPMWGGVSGSVCIASQATRCLTPTSSGPSHRVPASPAPLVSSWIKSGGFGRRAQGTRERGEGLGWLPHRRSWATGGPSIPTVSRVTVTVAG